MTNLNEINDAEQQIAEQSKRIGYNTVEYSIDYLADKLRDGEFYIPDYQRASVWEPERKSRFIESLLLGLPIPFLFFWENVDDGRLEIVDGSQRIRTIREFLDGEFTLGELEVLSKVGGFTFGDLTVGRQRKLKNRTIRGVVLDEQADDQARAELFDRINTGSKDANPAEIRRGALPGPFTDLITDLANRDLFVRLAPMSAMAENSRTREELAARFFALSGDLEGYRDRVADYVFEYSRKMKDALLDNPKLADEMRHEFIVVMEFISENFPYGFRKNERGTATPKTRYEAIAIGTKQALTEKPDLRVDKEAVKDLITSDDFSAIVRSDGANAKARLIQRTSFIKNGLLERAI
ncbi:DUF262 domain-containing protein [Rhodococcus pyridinivorans]|uniref:DUF262 domain-containing protein n=1 Tax=Rhodococcus pyridinivorans TaxID=103816 RepID=UPI001FFEB393|nr:DUF262 domain-containing protein [Rhodococcus pyridinivorans]UPK62843.1 DUF262 domain-containing protein [Rhodococcus pyridinivorans]